MYLDFFLWKILCFAYTLALVIIVISHIYTHLQCSLGILNITDKNYDWKPANQKTEGLQQSYTSNKIEYSLNCRTGLSPTLTGHL